MKRLSMLVALVLAATASIVGLSASPALASAAWQTYTPDSNWTCSSPREFIPHVFLKSCVVINPPNNYARSVVIISNYRGSHIQVDGQTDLMWTQSGSPPQRLATHTCTDNEIIQSGTSRACFGPWRHAPCRTVFADNWIWYDWRAGTAGGQSPYRSSAGC